MADAVTLTKALAAASATAIALSQAVVSGTPLALNGALVNAAGVAVLDTPRRVLLTFGNETQARTLLLAGTNSQGVAISETLAVASGGPSTVASLQDFATITAATPAGGGWSANASLGTNGVGSTPWQLLNNHITPFEVGIETVLLSGAANWTIEATEEAVLARVVLAYTGGINNPPPVPTPIAWTGLTNLSANTAGYIDIPVIAWRLTVNSGTGTVRATATQAGIRN